MVLKKTIDSPIWKELVDANEVWVQNDLFWSCLGLKFIFFSVCDIIREKILPYLFSQGI